MSEYDNLWFSITIPYHLFCHTVIPSLSRLYPSYTIKSGLVTSVINKYLLTKTLLTGRQTFCSILT